MPGPINLGSTNSVGFANVSGTRTPVEQKQDLFPMGGITPVSGQELSDAAVRVLTLGANVKENGQSIGNNMYYLLGQHGIEMMYSES